MALVPPYGVLRSVVDLERQSTMDYPDEVDDMLSRYYLRVKDLPPGVYLCDPRSKLALNTTTNCRGFSISNGRICYALPKVEYEYKEYVLPTIPGLPKEAVDTYMETESWAEMTEQTLSKEDMVKALAQAERLKEIHAETKQLELKKEETMEKIQELLAKKDAIGAKKLMDKMDTGNPDLRIRFDDDDIDHHYIPICPVLLNREYLLTRVHNVLEFNIKPTCFSGCIYNINGNTYTSKRKSTTYLDSLVDFQFCSYRQGIFYGKDGFELKPTYPDNWNSSIHNRRGFRSATYYRTLENQRSGVEDMESLKSLVIVYNFQNGYHYYYPEKFLQFSKNLTDAHAISVGERFIEFAGEPYVDHESNIYEIKVSDWQSYLSLGQLFNLIVVSVDKPITLVRRRDSIVVGEPIGLEPYIRIRKHNISSIGGLRTLDGKDVYTLSGMTGAGRKRAK